MFYIKLPYNWVVKLEPVFGFFSILDVRVVVSVVCEPEMNDNSLQFILVIFRGVINKYLFISKLIIVLLCFSKVVLRVFLQIKLVRKLAKVIDFSLRHRLIVKIKPLESNNKMIWQLFNADSLYCCYLLTASIAVIGIFAFQHLAFNECIQAFVYVFLIFYLQTQRNERLFIFRIMRTIFANDLVGNYASKVIVYDISSIFAVF